MKKSVIKLLIIEDEAYDVKRILNTLVPYKKKINVQNIVSTGTDAIELIRKKPDAYDVVVLDYQISGGLYGVELITALKRVSSSLQIVVITKMTLNQADVGFASDLIESGASWFGTKNPVDMEDFIYQPTDFVLAIQNAYEKSILGREKNRLLNERNDSFNKLDANIKTILDGKQIIGNSEQINQVKFLISRYADIDAVVLILGESGTGKELVATHLHYLSKRRFENFVTVNCSAIPDALFENEFFGHEKGAFTDARATKRGFFEQANNGTLFLDEVAELSLAAQAKLLRVLETGEIDKIGRENQLKVNVRIIAATNKDMAQLVQENKFRQDLFYRLNILNIHIPPLRERTEDIHLLFNYFIDIFCLEHGLEKPRINDDVESFLENYSWKGNTRQVKNLVLRMLLIQSGTINMNIVRLGLGNQFENAFDDKDASFTEIGQIIPLKEAERKFRKKYVSTALGFFKTDSETAQKLGVAKSNFHRMLKDLGLK